MGRGGVGSEGGREMEVWGGVGKGWCREGRVDVGLCVGRGTYGGRGRAAAEEEVTRGEEAGLRQSRCWGIEEEMQTREGGIEGGRRGSWGGVG